MKKILGISLCALFAVSAANANIASEGYVNEKVGSINLTGITTNANNISALTNRVAANESTIGTHTTNIQANTTKINNLDTAIQGMGQPQTTGDYVRYVKQENGDVTAEGESFDTSVSDESESNKAPTSKAVAAYVKGKVDGLGVGALEGRVDANEGAIAANTSNIATNATNIQTNKTNIQTNAGNIATNTTNIATLDGRVDGHDTSITNLTGRVAQNETDITALETSVNGLGDLAHKDTVATADIDANAVTSAQIANDAVTSAKIVDATIMDADINNDAQIASSKIKFNDTQTAVFGSGITQEHVNKIDANATAITGINSSMTTLTGRVDANETAITALETSVDGLGDLAHKDTVATADIDANAVTSAQIANDAVTSAKIDDETITDADIAIGAAIATTKIAFTADQTAALNSTINSTKVAQIAANASQITANGNEIGRLGDILKPSEQCLDRNNSHGCTLVIRNGDFSWEAVTRGEEEQ